jgi:hypothetical protein
MLLGITQARFDKFNVLLRGGDALLRFLLESVQHVHHAGKTHGINGPVGVAVEIIDQLQDSTPAKSLQRLCGYRFLTFLHLMQGVSHAVLHLCRKSLQILTAGANKDAGFRFGPFYGHFLHYGDIPIIVKGAAVNELRIDHGPGYRVYYTRRGKAVVILLCGGDKRTQSKDIRKAKEIAETLED